MYIRAIMDRDVLQQLNSSVRLAPLTCHQQSSSSSIMVNVNLFPINPLVTSLFLILLHHVKHEIMLSQPPTHNPNLTPLFLPDVIAGYLAETCHTDHTTIGILWRELRDIVWMQGDDIRLKALINHDILEEHVRTKGKHIGIGEHALTHLNLCSYTSRC